MKNSIIKLIKQIIAFSIVGVSNTVVAYIVYLIIISINSEWYFAGYAAGFVVSTFNAYFWNNLKVFSKNPEDAKKAKAPKIFKTYVSYGFSFLINMLCLYIFVDICNINEKIAPLLIMFITYPMNYLLNKFWVYKNKVNQEEKDVERQN